MSELGPANVKNKALSNKSRLQFMQCINIAVWFNVNQDFRPVSIDQFIHKKKGNLSSEMFQSSPVQSSPASIKQ